MKAVNHVLQKAIFFFEHLGSKVDTTLGVAKSRKNLSLRGSYDFESVEEYQGFIDVIAFKNILTVMK